MPALVAALCLVNVAALGQAAATLAVSNGVACVGQQVTFTLTTSLAGDVVYKLYKGEGAGKEQVGLQVVSNTGSAAFTVVPQSVTIEKYVVEVCPIGGSCVDSNEQYLVVVPPPTAGKIDHSKNTP